MLEREYKGHETARIAIEKLSPKSGDIVVITFPNDILREQMKQFAKDLNENLKETGNDDIVVMCMKGGMQASVITEKYLNEAGYFRREIEEETSH